MGLLEQVDDILAEVEQIKWRSGDDGGPAAAARFGEDRLRELVAANAPPPPPAVAQSIVVESGCGVLPHDADAEQKLCGLLMLSHGCCSDRLQAEKLRGAVEPEQLVLPGVRWLWLATCDAIEEHEGEPLASVLIRREGDAMRDGGFADRRDLIEAVVQCASRSEPLWYEARWYAHRIRAAAGARSQILASEARLAEAWREASNWLS